MTCTGFGEAALYRPVDVDAAYGLKRYGLVAGIHDGKVFNVFQVADGDTGLDPACPSVGEVVPSVRILVDGVVGVGVVGFHNLPGPRP